MTGERILLGSSKVEHERGEHAKKDPQADADGKPAEDPIEHQEMTVRDELVFRQMHPAALARKVRELYLGEGDPRKDDDAGDA